MDQRGERGVLGSEPGEYKEPAKKLPLFSFINTTGEAGELDLTSACSLSPFFLSLSFSLPFPFFYLSFSLSLTLFLSLLLFLSLPLFSLSSLPLSLFSPCLFLSFSCYPSLISPVFFFLSPLSSYLSPLSLFLRWVWCDMLLLGL